jgi:hypothetical protein
MRKPLEGFDGGDDDQKQIQPEQRGADREGGCVRQCGAEFITFAIGGESGRFLVWGEPKVKRQLGRQ